ncbi:GNAT family N-acetyltransferase [Candidatus Kapabacteria bacterium]|nr:GNAT family N-acetyltransferase [Candidatus Kapabacteria bacterium]
MVLERTYVTDTTDILKVFKHSVQQIGSLDYSQQQIEAWISSAEDIQKWKKNIANDYFIKAVKNDYPVGFASLKNNNFLDYLYISPNYQKKGIAQKLLNHLISIAKENKSDCIKTNSSKSALKFFLNNGFEILDTNILKIGGTSLENYKMILML